MARVYFSLGSNIEPVQNLRLGINELQSRYGNLDLSAVYRSAAVGFDGDDFLNLAAGCDTDAEPPAIQAEIEKIHRVAGRRRGEEKFSSRPLDIDLLLYDERVVDEPGLRLPRADILEYSFVLCPLVELAADFVHPLTGKSLAEHWREFDRHRNPLSKVDDLI